MLKKEREKHLKGLVRFQVRFGRPIVMANACRFGDSKAYKNSKLVLTMLALLLHAKFYKSHNVTFSSIGPGCVANMPLF
jgi:protochlorophyllide reductase